MYILEQFEASQHFIINSTLNQLTLNSKTMESTDFDHESTCLLCCQERDIFVLPKCNHKNICWRCCMNMIKAGNFQCPLCKGSVHEKQMIIFVTLEEMTKYSFGDIVRQNNSQTQLFKSQKNSNFFYTCAEIAQKIEYQTSYNCPLNSCNHQFDNLNQLKKHLDLTHQRQYCDICLTNRKCILSQQILYTTSEYQRHIKQGQISQDGDLVMYHPTCDFCKISFYDIDEFKRHLDRKHEKCHHCQNHSEELKYIYYKDYDEAERHFRKSHHLCEIGDCLNTKIQNVFVSESALQEHIQKKHKKAKKGSDQPVMNMLLGFNKTDQETTLQWDNIGKNYKQMFNMVEKYSASKLTSVDHCDAIIDIRDFYNEMTKRTSMMTINQIKQMALDRCYEFRQRAPNSIGLDDIDLFRPLEMQSLSRGQLDRFLHQMFQHRLANLISDKFFQDRASFRSIDQYYNFIKAKMMSHNKVAYYYVFPQLVRFYKAENPSKQLMDNFYYESLRDLKVKKEFIIHKQNKYSQILLHLKRLIEKQLEYRDQDPLGQEQKKELDIEIYLTYIKEMNQNYFIKNQTDIFFVSKDKITNLYHMISKCRVQDFLKMNWLLKIGFSNEAYKIIQRDCNYLFYLCLVYYKFEEEGPNAMSKFTIQELAYLYAYTIVCLESLQDKSQFKKNKSSPVPLFLSEVLIRMKKSSSHFKLKQIQQAERKSLELDFSIKQRKDKGIIINEKDHPSILDQSVQIPGSRPPDKKQPKDDFPVFGAPRPRVWKAPKKVDLQNDQQYPSLCKAPEPKNASKIEEQDFPVYNYKPINMIGKQKKKEKNMNNQTVAAFGWGGSSYIPNQWNESDSLKSWQKRMEQQEKRKKKRQKQQLKEKIKRQQGQYPSLFESKIQQKHQLSKDQQKQAEREEAQESNDTSQPMSFIKPKKTNRIDEWDFMPDKKNKKKKGSSKNNVNKTITHIDHSSKTQKQSKKQSARQQEGGLFDQIQKEEEIAAKMKKQAERKAKQLQIYQNAKLQKKMQAKREPFRIDDQGNMVLNTCSSSSDSEDESVIDSSDFPQLSPPLVPKKKYVNSSSKKAQQPKDVVIEQKKPLKKPKIRFDMSSSDEEEQKKKNHNQEKKQQQFQSISQRFDRAQPKSQNPKKQSKVNQIINASRVETVQNEVVIKRGKKGKKVIIQKVNMFGNRS